jgi:hypothetical protein
MKTFWSGWNPDADTVMARGFPEESAGTTIGFPDGVDTVDANAGAAIDVRASTAPAATATFASLRTEFPFVRDGRRRDASPCCSEW